jgi:putative Holliday junction resolvase
MSTILAFDFGARYLGLAVGDTETRMAHPLEMHEAEGKQQRFEWVDQRVHEWKPARLLVGLPLAPDGSDTEMTRRARRFARQLAARFHLPLSLVDERFSSTAAEETLAQSGRGGRRHKHQTHALSAQIILQGFLDECATA